jgi:hypothetical protein
MTEFFAGAGGTSQGAAVVPGLRQVLAANHSRVAMSTHAANFPEVEHDVADLSQVTPRRYRRTEILWASPECTWQTGAAGRPRDDRPQPALFDTRSDDTAAARQDRATREVAERSRATMFDVLRFAEHHRYDAILVENVVEAATLWLLWRSWLLGLHDLGTTPAQETVPPTGRRSSSRAAGVLPDAVPEGHDLSPHVIAEDDIERGLRHRRQRPGWSPAERASLARKRPCTTAMQLQNGLTCGNV